MSATVVNTAGGSSSGSGTTCTITVPSGVGAADYGLIVAVSGTSVAHTVTLAGTGLTKVTQIADSAVGSLARLSVILVSGAAAGTVITGTWSGSVTGRGLIGIWYTGTSGLDAASPTAFGTVVSSSPATLNAMTTGAANETVSYVGVNVWASVPTSFTLSAGTLELSDTTTTSAFAHPVGVFVSDAVQSSAGSTGTATLSWSGGASLNAAGFIVAWVSLNVTATGSITLGGSAQPGTTAAGSITLGSSATATAHSSASGSLSLGGAATATAKASAAGALTLGGSGTAKATPAATGSLSLGGTAKASTSATGSITLSGAAQPGTSATGALTLGGSATGTASAGATGSVTLGSSAWVEQQLTIFTQDWQNGQTSGTTVTNSTLQLNDGNNIGAGLISLDAVGSTLAYSTSTPLNPAAGPLYGLLRMRSSGSVFGFINHVLPQPCGAIAVSQYISPVGVPGGGTWPPVGGMVPINFRTAANGPLASVGIGATTGKLQISDSLGATVLVGSYAMLADTLYRIEAVISAVSTTGGTMTVNLYLRDDTTSPLDTLTVTTANFANSASQVGQVSVGQTSASNCFSSALRLGWYAIAPFATQQIGPYRQRAWTRASQGIGVAGSTAIFTQGGFTSLPQGQGLLVAFVSVDEEDVPSQPASLPTAVPSGFTLQQSIVNGNKLLAVYTGIAGGPAGAATTDGSYVWTFGSRSANNSAVAVNMFAVANANIALVSDGAIPAGTVGNGGTASAPYVNAVVGAGSMLLVASAIYRALNTDPGAQGTAAPGFVKLVETTAGGVATGRTNLAVSNVGVVFPGAQPPTTVSLPTTLDWQALAVEIMAARYVGASGSITLGGAAQGGTTASGSITLGGTGQPGTTASGSISLGGTATGSVLSTAAGSISLAGTATAKSSATAAGSVTLGGTAQQSTSATGAITLVAAAASSAAAAATGAIVLGAAATAGTSATGSVALAGSGAGRAVSAAVGAISLSGTAAASGRAAAAGSIVLGGAAQQGTTAAGAISLGGTASVGSGSTTAAGAMTLGGAAQGGGSAAGAVTLSAAAAAQTHAAATGGVALGGSAHAGTSTAGSVTLAGSAASSARAAATGSVTLSASASGLPQGTASGSITLTGSASTQARPTAAGSITLTGSAAPLVHVSATGSITLTGTASSSARPAVAGSIIVTGVAAGAGMSPAAGTVELAGSASGGATVAAAGAITLAGTAQQSIGATGHIDLLGSARAKNVTRQLVLSYVVADNRWSAAAAADRWSSIVQPDRWESSNRRNRWTSHVTLDV